MAYKYLEHEADVGILAIGNTLEEAFSEGAKAMFGVMVDIKGVEAKKEIEIECNAKDIPSLFVEWLNELVHKRDTEDMFFSKFKIEIEKNDGYKLIGKAIGEKIDLKKHEVKTEVKAATYSGLKYEEKGNKHQLQCILDI
jgi:SHS2 domain-containing protein